MAKKAKKKKTNRQKTQLHKRPTTQSLPPRAETTIGEQFATNPATLNNIVWNNDQAYSASVENADRMLNDGTVFSALRERQYATAEKDFHILPPDEKNPEHQEAADFIHDVVMMTPYRVELFRCLLDAVWRGREAIILDWDWDFSGGVQKLKVTDWLPVHGDSLLFGLKGEEGYRVGSGAKGETITTVEGRGKLITPEQREAWIIHHHERSAGAFNNYRQCANVFGVGLRSHLYGLWYSKYQLQVAIHRNVEQFTKLLIYYYQMNNEDSKAEMAKVATDQPGSSAILAPRDRGGNAAEGIETINPPSGVPGMLELWEQINKEIRLVIVGENLTSEPGPNSLGGNLGETHYRTFQSRVHFDALNLQETLTRQFVAVIQKYSAYRHLPPMRLEFVFDNEPYSDKLDKATKLAALGVEISKSELLRDSGFSVPLETEDTIDVATKLKLAN